MQGRNRDVDSENRYVDTVREGKSRTNGESRIDIHTLSCVKQIANKELPYNSKSPAWCSVITQRGGMAGGEGGSTGRMADGGGCRQKPT